MSGSRAYGTNLPHSDTDLKGVFVLPEHQFYGLDYVSQVANETNDEVFYELRRFEELLLKNNPTVLELPQGKSAEKHRFADRGLLECEGKTSRRHGGKQRVTLKVRSVFIAIQRIEMVPNPQ